MPQSRDRRSIPVDIAAVFARRRASALGIFDDELNRVLFGPTPRPAAAAQPATPIVRIPRNVAGRGRRGENSSPRGSFRRGSGRVGSVLPSWYPRTPLRDVTAVVRAIERRRARLRENDGQQTGTNFPADQLLPDPSESHLEQSSSMVTPKPAVSVKLRTPSGMVPMILLDIANQKTEGESELTPQKKLLNSIDNVEKVVREELQRLKRTPSAKKAEREKRIGQGRRFSATSSSDDTFDSVDSADNFPFPVCFVSSTRSS